VIQLTEKDTDTGETSLVEVINISSATHGACNNRQWFIWYKNAV